MIPNQKANHTGGSTYQQWVKNEGIPVIREFFIRI